MRGDKEGLTPAWVLGGVGGERVDFFGGVSWIMGRQLLSLYPTQGFLLTVFALSMLREAESREAEPMEAELYTQGLQATIPHVGPAL